MKKFDLENLTIYFKGEIYNINKFVFNDVSLLLQDLYFKFGFDFVSKLVGVFAFCIYDKRKNLYSGFIFYYRNYCTIYGIKY